MTKKQIKNTDIFSFFILFNTTWWKWFLSEVNIFNILVLTLVFSRKNLIIITKKTSKTGIANKINGINILWLVGSALLINKIIKESELSKCKIILPVDVVVAEKLERDIPVSQVSIEQIPEDKMIFDN